MNKQNVMFPFCWVQFNNKKEWTTDTCSSMDEPQKITESERNQTQELHYKISLIWNF